MKIEVTQAIDIEIPPVPAHLKVAGTKKASMPIGDLPEDALRQVGLEWTRNLLDAAGYGEASAETGEE